MHSSNTIYHCVFVVPSISSRARMLGTQCPIYTFIYDCCCCSSCRWFIVCCCCPLFTLNVLEIFRPFSLFITILFSYVSSDFARCRWLVVRPLMQLSCFDQCDLRFLLHYISQFDDGKLCVPLSVCLE